MRDFQIGQGGNMNKKAQSLGLSIMSAIFLLIVGLMVVNFIMPEVSTFRIDLNCASASNISDGTKLTCLVGDAVVPYFIYIVIASVIGLITARLLL